MNQEKLKSYWYPILKEGDLNGGLVSATLLDVKLVLMRINSRVFCFIDKCPHRGVPLSMGKIVGDKIQCCYHGWEFDCSGKLTKTPGYENCGKDVSLKKFETHTSEGVVWVKLEGDRKFQDPFIVQDGYDSTTHFKVMNADFIHSIENFLDPMHTFFVHRGLLRGRGKQHMDVSQTSSTDGFITKYKMTKKQNGLINKLFGNGIDTQVASFTMPGLAKIEYYKNLLLKFRVAIFFIPTQSGKVKMLVNVSLKKTLVPSFLKFIALRPFLEIAYLQDKNILELHQQSKSNQGTTNVIIPTDLVIDHLLHLVLDKEKGVDKKMHLIV